MKRQLISVGLIAIVFLLLLSLPVALATPMGGPRLQTDSELEPNNSFVEANEFEESIRGEVYNTPITETIDYFLTDTTTDRKYQALLTVDSPENLRLRIILFNADQQRIQISSASSTNVDMTWTARTSSHYFRIEAVTVNTSTVKTAKYRLDVFQTAEPTDTPTPTNTPQPRDWDEYEPNDSFGEAHAMPIATSVTLSNINFYRYEDRADADQDWFSFYTKEGGRYQARTANLNNVDTKLQMYDRENNKLSIDDVGSGFASRAEWKASYTGYYYIRITNEVGTSGVDDTYDLIVEEQEGAPTTSTPGPTPRARADDCESNGDFGRACVIPANTDLEFNLVPVFGEGPDNDFYKIWVKPGLHFRCATSNLAPGVDPNMIVFSGPSWDQAIGGNDDVSPTDLNSAFNYYASYSGWLYVLVGTGDRTPSDLLDSSYTLRCDRSATPLSATSTPEPTTAPRATPTSFESPVATPTAQNQSLSVRPLTTPTPIPPSAPRFLPIDLLVYYDANGDGVPGAGEGITGIPARAYDVSTNQLLAQGHTDLDGQLAFTVAMQGSVRLSIPFLDFSHLIPGGTDTQEGASVRVRVPPHGSAAGAP